MMPAIRRQSDIVNQKEISDRTGLDCSDDKDLARQEDKADADINNILKRYGIGTGQQRQPFFGEIDYDLDLQNARQAVRDAEHLWLKLPDPIRDKYPTWQQVLSAAESGQLKGDLDALAAEKKEEAPPAPTPVPTT